MGVAIAVVLSWLAVTGVLLNHPGLIGDPGHGAVVAFDPLDPDRRFRGGALLEVSEDGGATWREVPMLVPAEDVVDIAFAPDRPRSVWVATRALGIVRARDGGVVWEPVDLGFVPLGEGAEIERLALGPGGLVLVVTTAGDLLSEDDGATWRTTRERPLRSGGLRAFVHQLHTGYVIGPELVLVHDLAGVGAVCLAISGLVIWWRPFLQRMRRRVRG